jgi:stearoyl-CoA desaturase (delta-9 desaturase)
MRKQMDTVFHILSFLERGVLGLSIGKMLIYSLITTHITIAAVTIFLHRAQAHRSLDLHAIPSHFFRLWLWLTTGMVTKEWVSIHRKHHAKCETTEDPHSPQTRGIRKVLFQGAELYRQESKNKETLEKYGHGTPNDWIEKNIYSKFSWQGVAITMILNVIIFGVFGLTIWAIQMVWIPFLAAGVINGLGHYIGYRNFDASDASTNLFPLAILIGGEELHNNHHTYPTSARLSNKWYEFDIGWLYIKILAFFKLATIKKVAPKVKLSIKDSIQICTEHTLNAIIHHRYDAMAKYKKMIISAYHEEAHKLTSQASQTYKKITDVQNLLLKERTKLSLEELEQLIEILSHSKTLHILYEMKQELAKLWEKSHNTSEQLLYNLQEWCKKAEESGMPMLANFSYRLKRYSI